MGVATNGIFPMYQICKEKRSNESIQVGQEVVDVEARVEDVLNNDAGEPAEVVQQWARASFLSEKFIQANEEKIKSENRKEYCSILLIYSDD